VSFQVDLKITKNRDANVEMKTRAVGLKPLRFIELIGILDSRDSLPFEDRAVSSRSRSTHEARRVAYATATIGGPAALISDAAAIHRS
jgi:hypothetical protein